MTCLTGYPSPLEACPLTLDSYEELSHRLSYCSRHPVTDINDYLKLWLKYLLEHRPRRRGSKIARRLGKYVNINFLSTLKGYYRLRRKNADLLAEFERLESVKGIRSSRNYFRLYLLIRQSSICQVQGIFFPLPTKMVNIYLQAK